ncbi:MAG: SDR family NAD(P)-dependent oxidoreductase [Ilumatobacter sp.]|uniref:SDR family NAD(P)-dependent oxidoreductase n=1 Tax=Ilumatobacter sp. TaxID=1967498 RepID=UPI00329739C2
MDNRESIGSRTFDVTDQEQFASMSGDVNPMHVDPVAARRTMFGRPVVHGVHVVLWALDVWCSEFQSSTLGIAKLTADFVKPVFVDDVVALSIVGTDDRTARLRVTIDDVVVTTVRVELHSGQASTPGNGWDALGAHRTPSGLRSPRDRDLDDLAGDTGTVIAPGPLDGWNERFPALAVRLGPDCVAAIAALSTIVGMECPGLHSLFGGFAVRLASRPDPDWVSDAGEREVHPSGVDYRVSQVNAKFSTVKLAVRGLVLDGEVRAFVRPRPTVQRATGELSTMVQPQEFCDVNALIVGGSRGLGEVAAKLIAAGGGHSTLSWHRGRAEAERVVADIRAAGFAAESTQLDVNDVDVELHPDVPYTHLLYFASPRISARRLRRFDRDLFDRLVDAYVDGFLRIADAVIAHSTQLVVLYPSSIYVTDGGPDFLEYAAAKAAGEVAAEMWAAAHGGAVVHIERLEALATDQTVALISVGASDAAEPVVRMLRAMHGVAAGQQH